MKKRRAMTLMPWPPELRPLIEEALDRFLPGVETQPEPLHRAMRYAVFSGGKRLRPQFLLHVAQACGIRGEEQDLVLRAACAVELIHTASLLFDDLPCFDNAAQRRGCPTVHARFGEARALLAGEALVARSFELLAAAPRSLAARSMQLVRILAKVTGSSSGLVGGQGPERDALSESHATEGAEGYHALKTGAMFAMAAEAAAVTAGSRQAAAWATVGALVGQGYQLAHALFSLQPEKPAEIPSKPAITRGTPSLLRQRPEKLLRARLAALSTTLHERIRGLAQEPELLLGFLDALCDPLLDPSGSHGSSPSKQQARVSLLSIE